MSPVKMDAVRDVVEKRTKRNAVKHIDAYAEACDAPTWEGYFAWRATVLRLEGDEEYARAHRFIEHAIGGRFDDAMQLSETAFLWGYVDEALDGAGLERTGDEVIEAVDLYRDLSNRRLSSVPFSPVAP